MVNSNLSMIPPTAKAGGFVPAPVSVTSTFWKAGAKPALQDVSPIMNRPAPGIDNIVRQTLRAIPCADDPSVGTIGWDVLQNGLRYGVRIKDNQNNDVFNIGVEVPSGQLYLHRGTTMPLAEKAHAVALIQQTLRERHPDTMRFLAWNFEQLEQACSNPLVGSVEKSPPFQRLLANAKLYTHFGLSFPDDAHYKDKPETVLLALEWSVGQKYVLIDCSRMYPLFMVGNANSPGVNMECMERSEAALAVLLAKDLAKAAGEHRLLSVWTRLETAAGLHGTSRSPATP